MKKENQKHKSETAVHPTVETVGLLRRGFMNFIEIDAEQAETNVPCNYYHEFQNALKSCEIDEYMDF